MRGRVPRWLIPAIGYAVSLYLIYHVYAERDWAAMWRSVQRTRLDFVLLAVLCDIAVYCVQGWRWNELLRPVGNLPVLRSMQAIYVGLFANEVMWGRPGEIIRSFLQARWSGVSFAVVVSSVVVERLFDGIWLILGFFITSLFVSLPPLLLIGSRILAVILLIIGGLLAIVMMRPHLAERLSKGRRLEERLRMLTWALRAMGNSPSFYRSFFLSLLYLVLQIGPIYFMQHALGLQLSLPACTAILIILRLGSVPPQAPGNVGTFQFLTILGAQLFGVPKSDAETYADLLFLVITVPLWAVGFFALLATKMKLSQITKEANPDPA